MRKDAAALSARIPAQRVLRWLPAVPPQRAPSSAPMEIIMVILL